MEPARRKQKPVILALDFGSTSLRAMLLRRRPGKPDRQVYVQNTQRGEGPSVTTLRYHSIDYPTIGFPFDSDPYLPVYFGKEVPGPHRHRLSTSLKYGMYILADCFDDLDGEFTFASPLVERAKSHGATFKATLRRGILALFAALRRDVDLTCQERSFRIESIAVTIPAHWTLDFEDVYRDILMTTFWSEGREPQITFIIEIEALVHCLVKDYPTLIGLHHAAQDYVCLFQDFGGHSSSMCLMFIRVQNQDGATKTSFYRVGEARGVGGGSEEWEQRVWEGAKSRVERLVGRKLNPREAQDHLDTFNFHKRQMEPGGRQCVSFTAETQAVTVGAAEITDHFHAAHKKCFELFETGLDELCGFTSGNANGVVRQVVVSGGTARQKLVQKRLTELCCTRGLKEPIFIEKNEADGSSAIIAKGAAYAVADKLTIQQFLDQGAAFGLQRMGRNRYKHKVWDVNAAFLLDKDYSVVLEGLEFKRGEGLKIVCDPFYRATSNAKFLHIDRCYDVTEEVELDTGVWAIELRLTPPTKDQGDGLWYLGLRKERTDDIPQAKRTKGRAAGTRERRIHCKCVARARIPTYPPPIWESYSLYLDPSSNCVLLGKPDKTLEEASKEADQA